MCLTFQGTQRYIMMMHLWMETTDPSETLTSKHHNTRHNNPGDKELAYYRVHKEPPWNSALSQINPIHMFTPYLFKIRFKNIIPSMSESSKWSHPFINLLCIFIYTVRATCSSQPILLDLIRLIFLYSTYYKAPPFVILSSFLLLPPSYVQVCS